MDLKIDCSVSNSMSQVAYEEARSFTPNGSPSGRSVGSPPRYFSRGKDTIIIDADGNEFLDCWSAAGHVILGHANEELSEAVGYALAQSGAQLGLPNSSELALARRIRDYVPCAEKIFFVNGGSDANNLAIRVARAVTKRKKIIKFEGGLQGWADSLALSYSPSLQKIGDMSSPVAVPESEGILPEAMASTIPMSFNNLEALSSLVKNEYREIAAILLEPMPHSVNLMPQNGFLEGVKSLCESYGIILIFDEVVTGFRHALGGAQSVLGITPDLTSLSKSMSNGFPISALCGRDEYMAMIGPEGPAKMTLTHAGNSVSAEAGLKTTEILARDGFYDSLYRLGDRLREELNEVAGHFKVSARCDGFGSVWLLYFSEQSPRNYRDVLHYLESGGREKDAAFRMFMLNNGVFVWPQVLNRCYLNAAHKDEDIDQIVELTKKFFQKYKVALRK